MNECVTSHWQRVKWYVIIFMLHCKLAIDFNTQGCDGVDQNLHSSNANLDTEIHTNANTNAKCY